MATKRKPSCISLMLLLLTACMSAHAQDAPSKRGGNGAGTAASYDWHDGDTRRTAVMLARDEQAEDAASPLFQVNGQLMTLPGGVLIRFAPGLLRSDIESWMQSQKFSNYKAVTGDHTWFVDTPPGLDSLTTANRLHENSAVEYATPNWARQRGLR